MDQPYKRAFAITPIANTTVANSTNSFSTATRAVYVGGAGNLKVLMKNRSGANSAVTFNSVPAGTTLNIAVHFVYSGNTTATNIVGLY